MERMVLPLTSQLNHFLYLSARGALRQLKYGARDDFALCAGITRVAGQRPHSHHLPLTLSLSFRLAPAAAKIDLARVTYLCQRLFLRKPQYTLRSTGYIVCATFSGLSFDELLSFFLGMRYYSNTKFLSFFASGEQLGFTLAEPLTFFPLVHPAFDYYDWQMPFVFTLSRASQTHVEHILDWYTATRLLRLLLCFRIILYVNFVLTL